MISAIYVVDMIALNWFKKILYFVKITDPKWLDLTRDTSYLILFHII